MPAPFDVVVLGDYCLDLIFTGLPAFPQLGAEVVASGFHMEPGGTFNSAAAMHRRGLHVGWAADFGEDDFSRFVLARAQAEGLDEALVLSRPGPLPNATEARRLTDQSDLIEAMRILADACPLVVVKDGAGGAYACDGGRIIPEPAIRVQPVDTTGAGDCFSAGFVKA